VQTILHIYRAKIVFLAQVGLVVLELVLAWYPCCKWVISWWLVFFVLGKGDKIKETTQAKTQ